MYHDDSNVGHNVVSWQRLAGNHSIAGTTARVQREDPDKGSNCSSSEKDWGLPPLKPLLLEMQMSQGLSEGFACYSTCKENEGCGQSLLQEESAQYLQYPHLDPDVVEEMERLDIIRRQNSV
jgi:hypothetical protein